MNGNIEWASVQIAKSIRLIALAAVYCIGLKHGGIDWAAKIVKAFKKECE